MAEQVIISISREYGSGGHEIAKMLSERFQLPYYDKSLLQEIASEKKVNANTLHKYDEVPKNRLLSRTVNGFNNSPEGNVAEMQFDFLRKKAASGESFVILGRCSEYILREYKSLISMFILASMDYKLNRTMEKRKMSEEEAQATIRRHDKKRKAYHNYYCPVRWGDARYYDITIDCSKLGIERTTDFLETYIRERMKG